MSKFAAFLLSFLALQPAGYSQVSFASINGTVRDSSGAVMPGTELLLKNGQTGIESRSVTNEQGVYVFLNVLPGAYTLEAAKAGFSTSRI